MNLYNNIKGWILPLEMWGVRVHPLFAYGRVSKTARKKLPDKLFEQSPYVREQVSRKKMLDLPLPYRSALWLPILCLPVLCPIEHRAGRRTCPNFRVTRTSLITPYQFINFDFTIHSSSLSLIKLSSYNDI